MSAERGLRLGLIGTDIAQSLSPRLHQKALQLTAIQGQYDLFECQRFDDAMALIHELRAGRIDGLNVTQPYKQQVVEYVDEFVHWDGRQWRPTLRPLSSVNTLARGNHGQLVGASTDGVGLGLAMRQAGLDLPEGPGLVLGAGGAADGLIQWLVGVGKTPRWISNRDSVKAARLVARFNLQVEVVDWYRPDGVHTASWVLQTTSAGHGGQHDEGIKALEHLPWHAWAQDTLLIDIVYSTGQTAAQRCALAHGGSAVDEAGGVWLQSGRAMLAGQAALSQSLWTRQTAPYGAILEEILLTS